jgi:hypothetical protein
LISAAFGCGHWRRDAVTIANDSSPAYVLGWAPEAIAIDAIK